MRRITQLVITAGVLCVGAAQAGNFFFDFNTDPVTSGELTISGQGTWQSSGGVGAATNANDGYLVISAGTSQSSTIIFADFDAGSVVQGFTFDADLRIGNGSQSPADGFSVNYCRASDPVLTGGAFATGPNCEANLPEEGTQTGIGIGFDAWDSGGTAPYCNEADQSIGPDVAAVTVRVDGTLILQKACPTRNPTDPTDPTSVQTGPSDGTGAVDNLTWQHLKVQLTTDAKLSVWWKGTQILTNYQTTFTPSPGRLVFAGRCGGSWENQDLDNIGIITTPAQFVLGATTATGLGDGGSVQFFDSGAGMVDTSKGATISLDGGAPMPASAVAKYSGITTVFYYGYPNYLVAGSKHTLTATVTDTLGRQTTVTNLPFTVQPYSIVDSAPAVAGVDTGKPGFLLRTYQTTNSTQPNDIWWSNEQLNGLLGPNQADTSSFTDNGYFDYTKNDSIGLAGYLNFDYGLNSDGDFTYSNGYPDATWPGLMPGIPNANIDNSSAEFLCWLKFATPGVYYMGVASDDGFNVTVGPNPADWGSLSLGQYNGGKGALPDVDFTFVITNTANFYPVRLMWENGTGGANCEWFVIKDGNRILVNDPSPTNNSGVTAYYSGPAMPAYVSDLRPNPDRTTVFPNDLSAMITDLGTTVTGTPKLYYDGAQLTTAVVSKSGSVTTIAAPPGFLMSIGNHSARLEYATSAGSFTNSWKFTVGGYFNPAWAVTGVDTSKSGFRLKPVQTAVWPNSSGQPNNNRWTLEQLAGLHGPNAANLTTATDGGFIDIATDASGNGLINYIINAGGTAGHFGNKTSFPGMVLGTDIPDIGNESIDVVCFLQFSAAGTYTLGFNSDDGFSVFAGANPSDWASSVVLGQFNGGTGSSDTSFPVYVATPGFYPVRVFWENGNGSQSGGNGAYCEWFVVQPDGTRVLLNDPNVDTGIKAFYKGPALPAYVSAFCPADGATGVLPYPNAAGLAPNAFGVQLTDGSTTVTPSSIAVTINGTAMTPVVSQSTTTPKVTTVTLPVTTPLPQGTNTAVFVYSTSAGSFTNTWSFTVGTAPTMVNAAWAVTGVDTSKVGFKYRPWQSPGQPNQVWWTEEQLAGLHGANNADLSILNDGKYLDYTGLINFDTSGNHDGSFTPQTQFYPNYPDTVWPGIPGANGTTDNTSAEMLTYLQFKQAGVYTMNVNSDDGFKVTVGPNPADWFALNLGQYDGGRGAGGGINPGTSFSFVIPAAGFYPFRLIWENGGGGCNCEWTMVNGDGARILINDPAAPEDTMVNAYYSGPALAAGITAVTPTPGSGTGNGLGSLQVKLVDNGTPVTQGSITMTLDGVVVTPTTSYANGITSITYDMIATGTHTNTLCYSTSAGGPFCTTWTFTTTAAPDGGVVLSTNLWTPVGSGANQGFAFKVFQSPNTNIFNGFQNNSRMADMMLQGLYGVNVADLTDFTNNGAMWLPGVINFASTDPTPTTAPTAGNFVASSWPDALWPGLGVYSPPNTSYSTNVPATTTMNYDCIEAKTFLEFSKPGYYVMGVSSDDGFRLTVGDQGSPGKSPLAVLAPASMAGDVTAMYTTTADGDGNRGFGVTPSSTVPIIAHVVLADPIDAQVGGTPTLNNAAAMKGNIALIQRGTIAFTAKYDVARDAGAVAVIIANNSANDTPANTYPGTMGGTDATNTIPVLWVNYANGTNLIAAATTTASSPLTARVTAQDCSPIVGGIDVGKGASDVLFGFTVPQAGVYPFRLIWENGTGGANCEWFVRDPALGDFLVGDPAGPVKAWITRDVKYAGALPAPKLNAPVVSGGNVMVSWTGEGELWEAYSAAGPWFKSTFQGNPATVVPSPTAPTSFFRVRMY